MPLFEWQSELPIDPSEVFQYHGAPGAFERLIPPWEDLQVLNRWGTIRDGDGLELRVKKGLIPHRMLVRHRDFKEGIQFVDRQERGPFASWEHQHLVLPAAAGSLLVERIHYELPGGGLSERLFGARFKRMLTRLFKFRHRRTRDDLVRHEPFFDSKPLVLLFVGRCNRLSRQLAAFLSVGGNQVYRLQLEGRDASGAQFAIRPFFGGPVLESVEGIDAVLETGLSYDESHFSGYLEQRYDYLDQIADRLAKRRKALELLMTFPGPQRSFDSLASNPSLDFRLSGEEFRDRELCEAAQNRLRKLANREIRLHPGHLIQSPLEAMIDLLIKLETFVFPGEGAQTVEFPWISTEDFLGAILHLLRHQDFEGDIALTSPVPSTRNQLQHLVVSENLWTYTIQRVLKVLPWAQPGMRPDLGRELAKLTQLEELGFHFLAPDLEQSYLLELGLDRTHSLLVE